MAISRVQAMRPALKDVIDLVNQLVDFEPYITNAVDEWLDEHPEATTTVEDGAITWPKLNEALQEKLEANIPIGTLAGTTVHIPDAQTNTQLINLDVRGMSTQAETPALTAPVNVNSVSSAAIKISYGDTPTEIELDLDSNILCSLPDGVRDELVIDSDGNVSIIQRVGYYEIPTNDGNWTVVGTNYNHPRDSLPRYISWTAQKRCNVAPYGDISTGANALAIKHHDVSLNDFLTAMNGQPVILLIALSEPVVINLGTITMPTISAANLDIWADTDISTTISITYERNISLALIAERNTALSTIAPIEGSTASANYAVGSYLIHDNKLCIVMTSIASGEPIIIGQNVTVTTVMTELVRLTQ